MRLRLRYTQEISYQRSFAYFATYEIRPFVMWMKPKGPLQTLCPLKTKTFSSEEVFDDNALKKIHGAYFDEKNVYLNLKNKQFKEVYI